MIEHISGRGVAHAVVVSEPSVASASSAGSSVPMAISPERGRILESLSELQRVIQPALDRAERKVQAELALEATTRAAGGDAANVAGMKTRAKRSHGRLGISHIYNPAEEAHEAYIANRSKASRDSVAELMRDPVSRSAGDALRSALTSAKDKSLIASVEDPAARTRATLDARRAYQANIEKGRGTSGIIGK